MADREGAQLMLLARALGQAPLFVAPPTNDLKDDLLHTGDPCPNGRGLSDLGFTANAPESILEQLATRDCTLLVGERVVEWVGAEDLAALPAGKGCVVLDCHVDELPMTDICVGVPNHTEREGTWINVDGKPGRIAPARTAPAGVWRTVRILSEITSLLEQGPKASVTA